MSDEQNRKDYEAYLKRFEEAKENGFKGYRTKLKPLRRKFAKINRNDKCTCGSNLKYKFCCLKNK